jgi:hypothetical protein
MTSQSEQLLKKEINTYGNKIADLTRLFIIGGISEETRNKRYKEVGYKLLSKVKEAREEGYLDGQRGVGLMVKREFEKSVISDSIKLQMIQFDIEELLKRLAELKK